MAERLLEDDVYPDLPKMSVRTTQVLIRSESIGAVDCQPADG